MLCRWLAVLVLAGFLLVIEAIAVSQGTLYRYLARNPVPESVGERVKSPGMIPETSPTSWATYRVLAEMFEITRARLRD